MPAPTAETLAESLRPLTAAPDRAAILCDVDGTLAPVVERAEDARVPAETAELLSELARIYACVACVSGRAALEARRLVGLDSIAYAGAHGAELLEPRSSEPLAARELGRWTGDVRRFALERAGAELGGLGVRLEDKGPIAAFHWRGAPDEEAARAALERVAAEARDAGLYEHWGRKVLEVRPPVRFDKGQAVRRLVESSGVRSALFGGDDTTDLDGFRALDALADEGSLDAALRVGVRSEEGPPAIVEEADLVVDGTGGFVLVLAALAVR